MGSLIGSTFRDTLAAQFNGIDEYMYVDNPTFKTDTQGAISIWLRPATIFSANNTSPFISYGVKDAGNNSRLFFAKRRAGVSTSNNTRFEISTRLTHNGTINSYRGATDISAGTLYHIIFQSNGSVHTLYLNGVLETLNIALGSNNGAWFGNISGSDHRLAFGCYFNSNAASLYNDCKENECIYVNRVLTGAEITALYNGGTPRNPHRITTLGSDLKSWWRFGDSRDDATTVYDEIGSNNLTLVNMDASNYVTP